MLRRIGHIISVLLAAILLVFCMLLGALASTRVQTAAVHVITTELTRVLGTDAHIGEIAYHFPAQVEVKDIYLADQQNDTLLYIRSLAAALQPIPLIDGNIHVMGATLDGAKLYAHRLPDSTYNYTYLLDILDALPKNEDDEDSDIALSLDHVEFSDIHVCYDEHDIRLDEAALRVRHLSGDSIDAEVLTFSGAYSNDDGLFVVEDIQARLKLNDTVLMAPTLYVQLPGSKLDASGVRIDFPAGDTLSLSQSASEIRAKLNINRAEIRPRDLGLFIPSARTIDGLLSFTGMLSGTLDSLAAKDLAVYYNDYCLIRGDISTVGLPNLLETHLTAHCEQLSVNVAVMQDFLSDLKEKPYTLPRELSRFGDTRYRGTISGKLTDLTLNGAFRTALGTITTHGRLISDTTFTTLHFDGKIDTRRFRLGKLLPESGLGDVALDVASSGVIHEGSFPIGTVHAHVDSIHFRDYTYRDICLHGAYSRSSYDGTLTIDDENIALSFAGIFDRTTDLHYDFDLKLDRFRPQPLHLLNEDANLALNMHVNLSGFDPDRMTGYLAIDSLKLRNRKDSLVMRHFETILDCDSTSNQPENSKSLIINSDYMTAKVWGQFAYTTLGNSIRKLAARTWPSLFSPAQLAEIQASHADNRMEAYIYGRELKTLQRVLRLPWRIADYPVVRAQLNDRKNYYYVSAHTDNTRSATNRIEDITLTVVPSSLSLTASIPEDTIIVAPKEHSAQPTPIYVPRTTLSLDISAYTDSLLVTLGAEMDSTITKASIGVSFARYAGAPLFNMRFMPASIPLTTGDIFHVSEGRLSYSVAERILTAEHVSLGTTERFVALHGVASPSLDDSLFVRLAHIPAQKLMPFILNEKVLTVGGDLSGWAYLYGLFSTPMFAADISLMDAALNGCRLGDVAATISLDRERNHIFINGDVTDSCRAGLVAHVDGLVAPQDEKSWQLYITPDSIPLGFINHWTSEFLTDIKGTASGQVQVLGRNADVWVIANVKANNVGLTIPYTGCRYYANDSVTMDSTSIRFPNLTLHDEENNRILFDGALTHNGFRDFALDLHAQAIHALALNLPDVPGELFSGHVYADGDVYIHGPEKDIVLDADAATFGKSRFRLSIDGASSAHDNSFVTFVNKDTSSMLLPIEDQDEFASMMTPADTTYIPDNKFTLNMGVEANRSLLFQLVLNEQTADMIQARGEGAIRFTMDPSEDIHVMGTYTLAQGSLGFTIANIIRRDFTIAEGSQIQFSGDPENPTLDVTAKYHVVASLRDLFGEDISSLATSRTSVPVECCVSLQGPLSSPIIRFSLELPMSEEAIRNQVKSIINTEEMLMRQVVYLLVFGRFYTPEYLQSTATVGANEVYSLLSSTITGQINSWLGKLTNAFTMGVNIRTEGEGATSSQEYEAQFQLQPVDRLVINGNVGYRYNDISNRPFFGDVDAEVLLTPNGKFRLKAYTHTVDKYSLRQASTIQGVGFLFRHDFNWPSPKRKPKETKQ